MHSSQARATAPGPPVPTTSRKGSSSSITPRVGPSSPAPRSKLPLLSRDSISVGSQIHISSSLPAASISSPSAAIESPGLLDFNSIPPRSQRPPQTSRRPSHPRGSTHQESSAPSGLTSSTSLGSFPSTSSATSRPARAAPHPSRSYVQDSGKQRRGSPESSSAHLTARRPSARITDSNLPKSSSEPSLNVSTFPHLSSKSSRPPPNSFLTRAQSPPDQMASDSNRQGSQLSHSTATRRPAVPTRAEGRPSNVGQSHWNTTVHDQEAKPTFKTDSESRSALLPELPAGEFARSLSLEQPLLGSPIGRSPTPAIARIANESTGRRITERRNRSRSPSDHAVRAEEVSGLSTAETEEKMQDRKDSGVRLMGLGIDRLGSDEGADGDRTIQGDEEGRILREKRVVKRLSGWSSASGGSGTVRSPSLQNGEPGHMGPPPVPGSPMSEASSKAFRAVPTALPPVTPRRASRSNVDSPSSSIAGFVGNPPSISPRHSSMTPSGHRQQSSMSDTDPNLRRPSDSSTSSFSSHEHGNGYRTADLTHGQSIMARRISGITESSSRPSSIIDVPARSASLISSSTSRARPLSSDSRRDVRSWAESQGLAGLGVGLLDPMAGLGRDKSYSKQAAASDTSLPSSPRSMAEGTDSPGSPSVSWGRSRHLAEQSSPSIPTEPSAKQRSPSRSGALNRDGMAVSLDSSIRPVASPHRQERPNIPRDDSTGASEESFSTAPSTPQAKQIAITRPSQGPMPHSAKSSGSELPIRPTPAQKSVEHPALGRPSMVNRLSTESIASLANAANGWASPPVPARNPLRARTPNGAGSSRASPLTTPSITQQPDFLAQAGLRLPVKPASDEMSSGSELQPPRTLHAIVEGSAKTSSPSPAVARGVGPELMSDRRIRVSASESNISEPSLGLADADANSAGAEARSTKKMGLSINVPGLSLQPIDLGSRRSTLVHSRSYSHPESPTAAPASATSSGSTDTPTLVPPPPSPHANRLTKRAHLIIEICATERAYAKDLALVRDAYLYRLRPSSQHSTVSTTLTNGQLSPSSRTSTFTTDTAATSQTSFFLELGGKTASPVSVTGADKNGGSFSVASRPPSLIGGHGSTSSAHVLGAGSMGRARSASKSSASPPAADMKAIFLNIEQLAGFAEELANSFEKASGDGSGNEPLLRDHSPNNAIDTVGRVFLEAVPTMTALYTAYCAKQSQANDRLHELQKTALYTSYFKDCWAAVQPYTNAWDLGSMLIKPVQRVLKYPLLFGDLLTNTSPVHPDYFNLRKAATSAREIGDSINEVKRRKDVVERALTTGRSHKVASGHQTDLGARKTSGPNLSFGFGKKIRDKIKDRSQNAVLPGGVALQAIDGGSEAQLKGLFNRMTEADRLVRRVGQEINSLPDYIQQIWVAQYNMVETWVKVAALQHSDLAVQAGERMEMYRLLVSEILAEPVRALDLEVRESILPAFSTLLQLGINPRALISKLQAQESGYHRVIAASRKRSEERSLDAQTREAAQEYTALHNQLLEELPAYLKGYNKILNMTILAFSRVQADFHQAVRARHRAFVLAVSGGDLPEGGTYDVLQADVEVMDGRAMVKNWHNAWKPFNEMIENLTIARGLVPSREGSAFEISPAGSLMRANSARTTSGSSRPSSLQPSVSQSRLKVPQSNSPSGEDGRSGLERELSGSRGGQLGRLRSSSLVQTLTPTANGGRPVSVVAASDMGSFADFAPPSVNGSEQRGAGRLGRPFSYLPPLAATDAIVLPDMHSSPILGGPQDSALSWEDEQALYQCVCVATFRLDIEIWYAGLRFLSIEEGNVIDILHEVGRVDNLVDLPIDVGVADDGLLVGRSSTGDVGLVLCSFLTPVQGYGQ